MDRYGQNGTRKLTHTGWPSVPEQGTRWQDTDSSTVRPSWRQRAAFLDGQEIFGVDYQIYRRCQLGWVEEPYTDPDYQRCGLAAAGLAALRTEHAGLSWHTPRWAFPRIRSVGRQ